METLFENVFPLLILFLVVGWWILRGVFKVVRRSVTGMDEEVEVGRLAEDAPRQSRSPLQTPTPTPSTTAEPAVSLGLDTTPREPTDSPGGQAHISDLPSIDDLSRENRRARDRMRHEMPSVTGLSSDETMSQSAPSEIAYPGGSAEMIAQAWDRIYSDEDGSLGT